MSVSMSVLEPKLETLLYGDVDFRSTNEVEVLVIISCLYKSAHKLLYVRRYVHMYEKVCLSVYKLVTLLCGDVDF